MLSDAGIDPLYRAVEEATEEAIVNALVAAEDMYGRNRNFVPALPHDEIRRILKKYETYLEYRFGEENR